MLNGWYAGGMVEYHLHLLIDHWKKQKQFYSQWFAVGIL
jgi:hypothetical protein